MPMTPSRARHGRLERQQAMVDQLRLRLAFELLLLQRMRRDAPAASAGPTTLAEVRARAAERHAESLVGHAAGRDHGLSD